MFDYIAEDPNCDWLKVHSVMFLNIQFYSSGTRPWNRQFGDQKLGMTEHAIMQFSCYANFECCQNAEPDQFYW
jgi:hypothetical protein